MKRLADDSQRFRVEDVPPRLHEKERVAQAFRDIERQLRDSGEQIDRDLHPESLDRSWNQLMMAYKERDQMIHDEIARLEKLQKLAEKVHLKHRHPVLTFMFLIFFRWDCSYLIFIRNFSR